LPPKVLLPEALLADSPMRTVFCYLSTVEIRTEFSVIESEDSPKRAVFCYLSTVEIRTEFSVIESEAEPLGTEIDTTVRVITTPYCPRMCERQDRQYDITLRRFCVTIVAV